MTDQQETPRRRQSDRKRVSAWIKDFLPIIVSIVLTAFSAVLYTESRSIDRTYADKDAQIKQQEQEIGDLRAYNTTQDADLRDFADEQGKIISALAQNVSGLTWAVNAVTKNVDNLTSLMMQHILAGGR